MRGLLRACSAGGLRLRQRRIDGHVRVLRVRALLDEQHQLGAYGEDEVRLGSAVRIVLGVVDIDMPDPALRVARDDEVPAQEAGMCGQPVEQAFVQVDHAVFFAGPGLHHLGNRATARDDADATCDKRLV